MMNTKLYPQTMTSERELSELRLRALRKLRQLEKVLQNSDNSGLGHWAFHRIQGSASALSVLFGHSHSEDCAITELANRICNLASEKIYRSEQWPITPTTELRASA